MNPQDISFHIRTLKNTIVAREEVLRTTDLLLQTNESKLRNMDEGITILTAVLSVTQEEVLKFIENIVTSALQYVYGEDYEFAIDYEMKRGQPEIRLCPIKDGLEYDPKFSCGVGVVDVCSFALRCACWALIDPTPASILICDEPFRNVHGEEENERLGNMVKKLSEMLGLQIIIVSGESALTSYADKIFTVVFENNQSMIK
jgi:hypothetical protein